MSGLLPESDSEVADVTLDVLDLGVGEQFDVGFGGHLHHLGGQDTYRAVRCREGLVQLGHPATDAWGLLDQVALDAQRREL